MSLWLVGQGVPQEIAALGAFTLLAILAASVFTQRRLARIRSTLLSELRDELADRRRIEQALREAEGFYHSLVETLPQSILRKDLNGRFSFANPRVCAELGKPIEEVIGKTDFDFFPRELAEKYRADDQKVLETGDPINVVEAHVTPSGEKLYVQVIKTPLYGPDGRPIGVQGIFWDVTERERAESRLRQQNMMLQEMARSERETNQALKVAQGQLVQSEKLVSLGQLIAGVAHEINNPLAYVTNNVAVLERDLSELTALLELYRQADPIISESRPELARSIQHVREEADLDYLIENLPGLLARTRDGLRRIQRIVVDLRVFARIDESDLNDADLNPGIESTVNIILGTAKKKDVKIRLDLAPLPAIKCYGAKINQVIMNLLSNAIDACPESGEVIISTRVADEAGVVITVSDTGCGIEPHVLDRIFDPFFTTKPVGQGTGLGLSISYGIVQDHGGSIEVASEPGRGATFTVRLPDSPPPSTRR